MQLARCTGRVLAVLPVFVLVLLLTGASPAQAIRRSRQFSTLDSFVVFERFAFEKHGDIFLRLSWEPRDKPKYHLLVCSELQYNDLGRRYTSVHALCGDIIRVNCFLNKPLVGGEIELSASVPEDALYFFALTDCAESHRSSTPVTVSADYRLVNPGGEELSTSHRPLPSLYFLSVLVFTILALVWFGNWLCFCRTEAPPAVYHIMTGVLIAKLVCDLFSLLDWQYESQAGVRQTALAFLAGGSWVLWRTGFWFAVLAMSLGYGVTDRSLVAHRSHLLLYIGPGLFLHVVSSLAGEYLLFPIIFYYVFLYRAVLVNIALRIRLMEDRLRMMIVRGVELTTTSVYAKTMLLKSFQSSVVSFVIMDSFVSMIYVFFLLYKYEYVEVALRQLILLAFYIHVGGAYCLRDSTYWRMEQQLIDLQLRQHGDGDGDGDGDAAHTTVQQQMGHALVTLQAMMAARRPRQVDDDDGDDGDDDDVDDDDDDDDDGDDDDDLVVGGGGDDVGRLSLLRRRGM